MRVVFLFVLFIFICFNTEAQNAVSKPKPIRKKKEVYELVNHTVKLNIPSLLFKAAAIQYEKKLSRSKTMALGIIYRPRFAAPFSGSFESNNNGSLSLETVYMLKTSRYTSLMVTPEFRFYFRKKAPRGLYLAPFLRYKHEGMKANYKYQESNVGSVMKVGEFRYRGNAIGAGILFGLQILAKNRIVVDFWFLGPWVGVNFTSTSSKLNTATLNEFDKAYVETVTEQYAKLFDDRSTYNWTASGFKNTNNRMGLGIRMFGINFGYSF